MSKEIVKALKIIKTDLITNESNKGENPHNGICLSLVYKEEVSNETKDQIKKMLRDHWENNLRKRSYLWDSPYPEYMTSMYFLWKPGEIQPRIDWIDQQIELLTSK